MSEKPKFNSRAWWREYTKDSPKEPFTSVKEFPVAGGVVLRRVYAGEAGYKFTPDTEKRDRLLAERALRASQVRRGGSVSTEKAADGAE